MSTRDEPANGGAPGGFDDRFDFILTSESVLSDAELMYVPGTYKAYGNNANNNCYNQEIISPNCDGPEYDLVTRSALYEMSDHLPVILDLQTNATLLNNPDFTPDYKFVFEGGNVIDKQLILLSPVAFEMEYFLIFNIYGQVIGRYDFNGQNRFELDISSWSSGIYYIVLPNTYHKPLKFIKR